VDTRAGAPGAGVSMMKVSVVDGPTFPAASVANAVISKSPSAWPVRSMTPSDGHGPLDTGWKKRWTVHVKEAPGSEVKTKAGVVSFDGVLTTVTPGAPGGVVSSTYVADVALLTLPDLSVTVTVNV